MFESTLFLKLKMCVSTTKIRICNSVLPISDLVVYFFGNVSLSALQP